MPYLDDGKTYELPTPAAIVLLAPAIALILALWIGWLVGGNIGALGVVIGILRWMQGN